MTLTCPPCPPQAAEPGVSFRRHEGRAAQGGERGRRGGEAVPGGGCGQPGPGPPPMALQGTRGWAVGLRLRVRLCWGAGSLMPDVPRSGRRTGSSRASTCRRWRNTGQCTRTVRRWRRQAGWAEGRPPPGAPPDWPSRPDCFGCLCWSHSETHLLYVAEKKRPKTESFFQTKALDVSDDDVAEPKKPDQAIKVLRVVASPGGPRASPGLCARPAHPAPCRTGRHWLPGLPRQAGR